jgi:RNA polymerase sigma-70 factor (ECF subfamily)
MPIGSHPGECRFPTTHWSLVVQAGRSEVDARRDALEQLLHSYLPALRAHLIRGRRLSPDSAEDLIQEFVTSRIIERDLLAGADRDRGKLRTFLLATLDRFLIDHLRRERAAKRSPDDPRRVQGLGAEEVADSPRSDVFDEAWAREVIQWSIKWMRDECATSGRDDVWLLFEERILNPLLGGTPPTEYEVLVGRCGLTSASQASNVLITAKRMFARTLRAVVGQYSLGDEAVESEIRDLYTILARGHS